MKRLLEGEKIFDYEYIGHRNYPLWELKIAYPELLYLIGFYKVNNIQELEHHEINAIEGGLNDAWYDSYEVDDDAVEDINWEFGKFLKDMYDKYKDSFAQIIKNREDFHKTIKELGFTKMNYHGHYIIKRQK